MELGLSLGETASSTAESPFASFLNKTNTSTHLYRRRHHHHLIKNKGLGFCMGGLAVGLDVTTDSQDDDNHIIAGGTRTRSTSRSNGKAENADAEDAGDEQDKGALPSPDQQDHPPVVQLNLLPLDPVLPRRNNNNNHHPAGFPWPSEHGNSEAGSSGHLGLAVGGFDVNQLPASADEGEDGAAVSSPNSTVSSFQIDFSIYSGGGGGLASNNNTKRDTEAAGLNEVEIEKTSSRASDEEENGMTRKKLRLSKDQSAFLEESFKEHNTLNPKQKLALAKQLNLRPRQVEVWFQNRRARTKLKQTEVDCEHLKRWCETLKEENGRLRKEVQELRALKTSHPYYMQLPATTLTMCPSCERVATTSSGDPNVTATTTTTTTTTGSGTGASSKTSSTGFAFTNKKPRFYPFSQTHHHHHHLHQSAAS